MERVLDVLPAHRGDGLDSPLHLQPDARPRAGEFRGRLGRPARAARRQPPLVPPFFAAGSNPIPAKREFDRYSFRALVSLCREGRANLVGFHPEGTRNKDADPYTLLPPKPGIGRLIKEADPQVVPVFVTGLSNDLPRQILGNWAGGQPIRVHFGPALDLSRFRDRRDGLRTYKEIGEFVMSRIAELAEQDRALYGDQKRTED
ncbi:MAG: 1-acyl-sn-glycerol-3-phosphate acyltransferase [Acidobacteria bacterium]|nr:1-acyl-sn-glycerol-3-phosphate acyltransferase [Acidobacteriota bacterium]